MPVTDLSCPERMNTMGTILCLLECFPKKPKALLHQMLTFATSWMLNIYFNLPYSFSAKKAVPCHGKTWITNNALRYFGNNNSFPLMFISGKLFFLTSHNLLQTSETECVPQEVLRWNLPECMNKDCHQESLPKRSYEKLNCIQRCKH